jgi:hypothetical protein
LELYYEVKEGVVFGMCRQGKKASTKGTFSTKANTYLKSIIDSREDENLQLDVGL